MLMESSQIDLDRNQDAFTFGILNSGRPVASIFPTSLKFTSAEHCVCSNSATAGRASKECLIAGHIVYCEC